MDAAPRFAFDIEIADIVELAPGEDLDRHGPFRIACAADCDRQGEVRHWYSRDADGGPADAMSPEAALECLRWLREQQLSGARLCAWNGLSFDLRWLGEAALDLPLAAEVALDLVDPMFQFFVQRGFPVGLAAVAEGLGVEETKLMSGADAPVEWARGDRQRVLDYVAGDCRITSLVVDRIAATRAIRWRTRRGTISSEPMPELRPVRELLDVPEPDTSWMDAPIPRAKFLHWIPPQVLGRRS
jgi:hypothetical protein